MSAIDATAALLTGGAGKRLGGTNKALLQVGAQSILDRQLAVLLPLFRRVVLVGRDCEAFRGRGVELAEDLVPEAGAPGGVHTAIAASESEWVFCLACDMPFVTAAPVRALWSLCTPEWDAVVPERAGHLEPLFGFYSKRCLPVFARALTGKVPSLQELLAGVRTCAVGEDILRSAAAPDLRFLENVNTPEDLRRARGHRGQ